MILFFNILAWVTIIAFAFAVFAVAQHRAAYIMSEAKVSGGLAAAALVSVVWLISRLFA